MAKGRPAKLGKKADERESRALALPPTASIAIPPMPPTLPPEAQEAWDIVCSGLPGLVISDIGDIEICVLSLHEYRSISALLAEHGYTRTTTDPETGEKSLTVPDAITKLHRMKATAANTYRYHADRLGLSRMARARLNLLDLASKSELASLAERVKAIAGSS